MVKIIIRRNLYNYHSRSDLLKDAGAAIIDRPGASDKGRRAYGCPPGGESTKTAESGSSRCW